MADKTKLVERLNRSRAQVIAAVDKALAEAGAENIVASRKAILSDVVKVPATGDRVRFLPVAGAPFAGVTGVVTRPGIIRHCTGGKAQAIVDTTPAQPTGRNHYLVPAALLEVLES